MFAVGRLSEKVLSFVKKFSFKGFYKSSTMGNRLSKEQEQCFLLIQQLFKAAGCLPDKGSLHLEYGEKQGTAALIVGKSLDKKRKGPMPAS